MYHLQFAAAILSLCHQFDAGMVAIHEHIPVEQACHIRPSNWLNPGATSGVTEAKASFPNAQLWIRQIQVLTTLSVVLQLLIMVF
jgi:hypothetical protein